MIPFLFAILSAQADEGMWLPEQLPDMAPRLTQMGLEIPATQLADPLSDPLGAIVSLGGCSAAFISDQGLVGTNHHCVEGFLGYNSSAGHDLNRDGTVAASQADELPAGPGARLLLVDAITDVTAQVQAGVKRRTPDAQRFDRVDQNKKALVAACEADGVHDCRVAGFWGGRDYRLISRRVFKDVRLVYAPPASVGSYGGAIDNWMWPRHSGDFSLVRAYVDKDGNPAEYSPDNVPYHPSHYLTIDTTGAQEGEFVMVAGYPGSTYRYRSAAQLQFMRDTGYPWKITFYKRIVDALKREAAASPEAAARLAAPIDWIGNGLKYAQGMNDSMKRADLVAVKRAQRAAMDAWATADRSRQAHVRALAEYDVMDAQALSTWRTDQLRSWLLRGSDLLSAASTALRLSIEREKPDMQRDAGYQLRDEERIRARLERMERTLWVPGDRALLTLVFEEASRLPADQRIAALDAWIADQGGAQAALDRLFTDPPMADTSYRLGLLDMDHATLDALDDPIMDLARAMEPSMAQRRAQDKARSGALLRIMPLVTATRGSTAYPDANSTLRVTVGHVQGCSPRDGLLYEPLTTGAGVIEKAGPAPFDAPDTLLAALPAARESRWADPTLHDLPVDFLTTLDTTGGNSGSPTLNGKGELVGFIFDGNYEAMSADWVFDPNLTRSIHVDIRYMLWMLEAVEQAPWILDELGVSAN